MKISALGLGVFLGVATFAFGHERGCQTAEILAINDDGKEGFGDVVFSLFSRIQMHEKLHIGKVKSAHFYAKLLIQVTAAHSCIVILECLLYFGRIN